MFGFDTPVRSPKTTYVESGSILQHHLSRIVEGAHPSRSTDEASIFEVEAYLYAGATLRQEPLYRYLCDEDRRELHRAKWVVHVRDEMGRDKFWIIRNEDEANQIWFQEALSKYDLEKEDEWRDFLDAYGYTDDYEAWRKTRRARRAAA